MKLIIPAIDLRQGQVVRLQQGDFSRVTTYSNDPINIAKMFIQLGTRWLHVVNLDGAVKGEFSSTTNFKVISDIIRECKKYKIKIQIGGGIRNHETIKLLVDMGVDRVILGTFAIENLHNLESIIHDFNSKIAVSLDVFHGTVRTRGWQTDSNIPIREILLSLESQGIHNFIITDIAKDGMESGLNHNLYQDLNARIKPQTKIIASGGVSTVKDIETALKYSAGVIVGRALYEGLISQEELAQLFVKTHQSGLVRRIIPCLDVKDGRVVKGVKFQNLRDSGDPIALAKYYNKEGADELIFLDISASIEGRKSMIDVIKAVAEEVFIPLTVGGGIRNIEDMTEIIQAGAEKISINSAAINNPDLITQGAKKFGSQCIVVSIDAKRTNTSWEVFTYGGTKSTSIDAVEWAVKAVELGAGELLVTSMDQDGTNQGYDLKLLSAITKKVSVPVIASGGAGKFKHFQEAIEVGAEAVLAASLFHFNKMNIQQVKEYLDGKEIPIRL